jgi:hypothetical protein
MSENQALIDITRKVYLKIGKTRLSKEIIREFLDCASGRNRVSEELKEDILCKQFVDSMVEVLASADENEALRGIRCFHKIVKTDIKIFEAFRPVRSIVRRLKLERFLMRKFPKNRGV